MKTHKIENQSQIPSIEEIQRLYLDDLRREAQGNIERKNQDQDDIQEDFFKAFRKFNDDSKDYSTDKNDNYYRQYRAHVEQEKENQSKQIERIENLIEYEEFFLRWERKRSAFGKSNSATRYHVDAINKLREELKSQLDRYPEAWEVYHHRKLNGYIDSQSKNKLVDVPYVADAKEKVRHSLNIGIPVYIVGHLGSGKTQLATEAALDFSIQNKIQQKLEEKLKEWFSHNPNATEVDAVEKFRELNAEQKQYYENVFTQGTTEEIEALQPLFISGSHNLTYEDMFVEKTLSLRQSFSEQSYKDYLNIIIKDFYIWMDEHETDLEHMSEEEQLQLKIQIWKSFSDLLVANNSAFGTEVKKIEREILIAVKEGRPVIVDELNTIAMQNLIGLNDILQSRVGKTAYITGVGPVTIQPGFAFIGTGNLSTDMVSYEGTNTLNPAFKSRFTTIEYNYVSQNITGEIKNQPQPEKNELFAVILTHLADENGNIQLPDAHRTLDELFRFAQLCRVTQNVFMGKWKENNFQDEMEVTDIELSESVLSIRNMLHVLDNWDTGEAKDLSKALWDGFISSITNADDQNYILAQAIRFGFFAESDGWIVKTKGAGETAVTYDEIRKFPYIYVRPLVDTLCYLDVVHLLFGDKGYRSNFPEELERLFGIESNSQMSAKTYQKLDERLSHLERSIELVEHLERKEGSHET